MSSARADILAKIRQALKSPSPPKTYPQSAVGGFFAKGNEEDLAIIFGQSFTAKSGQLIFIDSYEDYYAELLKLVETRGWLNMACWEPDLATSLTYVGIPFATDDKDLHEVEASFTLCEALVARTGSILVSSAQGAGRRLTIYPPVHIVVATTSQLVADIAEGLEVVRLRYPSRYPSMVSLVSGPSRTADIEKTLVMGAHGPKELILFLIDDSAQ